jgi:molybdenum cofactor cytidylyltransferase
MKIAILILAAGSSTRMGLAKQLLPVGKTTLLGITIEHAQQSNADKVYCILGANAETIEQSIKKHNVEILNNTNYKTGLSSSIVKGVKHITQLNFNSVLILLGDQPHVTSDYLNDMINTHKIHSEKIIASHYNKTLGVPTIIPRVHFKELLKLQGDKGAKAFLNSKKQELIQLENANFHDIDTKEDYQDFLKSINLNKNL